MALWVSVPERGFVALIPSKLRMRWIKDTASGFSPRAGIRGFDTDGDADHHRHVHVQEVSVPERGFVALIGR